MNFSFTIISPFLKAKFDEFPEDDDKFQFDPLFDNGE